MKYKMLVLDMDDTLLTDNHTISKENRAMIAMAQAKGVEVVLASGRPTPAMTHYAKDLQNSYMISFNGAVVTDLKNDTVIFEQSLTKEQIHELHDYSLKMKTHIITYINDTIVSETHSEFIEVERSITGMPHELVSDFKAAVTSNAVKCILLEDPGAPTRSAGRNRWHGSHGTGPGRVRAPACRWRRPAGHRAAGRRRGRRCGARR